MKAKNLLIFTGIGFELIGIIIVSFLIGQFLEDRYSLGGLGVAGAILGGLFLWIFHVVTLLTKITDESDDS